MYFLGNRIKTAKCLGDENEHRNYDFKWVWCFESENFGAELLITVGNPEWELLTQMTQYLKKKG